MDYSQGRVEWIEVVVDPLSGPPRDGGGIDRHSAQHKYSDRVCLHPMCRLCILWPIFHHSQSFYKAVRVDYWYSELRACRRNGCLLPLQASLGSRNCLRNLRCLCNCLFYQLDSSYTLRSCYAPDGNGCRKVPWPRLFG